MRRLVLAIALLTAGLLSCAQAATIIDGTQVAVMAGFPGRMGPLPAASTGYSIRNTETTAILAAMSPQDTSHTIAIDTVVTDFKSSGIWTKQKVIYFLAASDASASAINWKNPVTNTLVVFTGSPTFTADRGWTFNNTSALNTGFNPTTASIAQNSENLSVFILNNVAANTYATGTSSTAIIPRRSIGDNVSGFSQNNTSTTGAAGSFSTSVGLTSFDRSVAGNFIVYKNGAAVETLTRASVGVDNDFLYIGAKNSATGAINSGGTHQDAFVAMGDSLSAAQQASQSAIVLTYMQAVGAQ
ncbi:hypothetical protein ABIB06_006539 [Bradyrhizobium sp. LB8.2]|uniref:hypothetical protein n=1 Tax=unclassified Bradyrhizobium TaxID=2631580 RepID=UPI003392EB9B